MPPEEHFPFAIKQSLLKPGTAGTPQKNESIKGNSIICKSLNYFPILRPLL
jgi:hypothetical protein